MASKAPTKPTKKPKPKSATAEPGKSPTIATSRAKGAAREGAAKETAAKETAAKDKARKSTRPPADAARTLREAPRRTKDPRPHYVPRAMPALDEDDVLMAHGGGGAGFGRCGGRLLGSRLEQSLCDRLGQAGVAHSHTPRHFEVRLKEGQVGAYAPMIVLRGRGREGKSVVIESTEEADSPMLKKIVSFRSQYGQEFYVILVATDEILDEVELAAYDESCSASNVNTLISRLAE